MRLLLVACAVLLSSSVVCARPHVRRHFEPTDLELEPAGATEIDLQFGAIRGPGPWRVVTPDFELDLGLAKWLELDIDGAYAVEGPTGKPFRFDHAAPDLLWPSLKLGLLDIDDDEGKRSYALGAQLGPKLPTFTGAYGVGVEGLLLIGLNFDQTKLALNLGGFVDPAADRASPRPSALEAGVDWQEDLDAAGTYSLGAGVAGVVFVSGDPAQLQASFGPGYAIASWLDLSLTSSIGFLPGGDRYGLLLGVSPHFPVWKGD